MSSSSYNNTTSAIGGDYQDVRSSPDVSWETQDDSVVMRVNLNDGTDPFRLLHLTSFMAVTIPFSAGFDRFGRPIRTPISNSFLWWDVAVFLAMLHFNERNDKVMPGLSSRLEGCDLKLDMELLDTQFSPIQASKQLYPRLFNRQNTLQDPIPAGLVGTILSSVAQQISGLAGVYGIPFVSPAAANSIFDDQHTNSPTFSRTHPSDATMGRAVIQLFRHWNVRHVGLVYPLDDGGLSLLEGVSEEASKYGISLTVAGYAYTGSEDIRATFRNVLSDVKDLRYLIGQSFAAFEELLEVAEDMGLMSDDHVWIYPGLGTVTQPGFSVPRTNERFANQINSLLSVEVHVPRNPAFFGELSRFKFDRQLRDLYDRSHAERLLDYYNWTQSFPILSTYTYTSYDAVMTMGIAACDYEGDFFNGKQYSDQVRKTTFDGLSGRIAFDQVTGSRAYEGVKYGFRNVRIDTARSTEDTFMFVSDETMLLDPSQVNEQSAGITELSPTVFRGGGTVPPPPLPALEEHQDLISDVVRGFGWGMAGLAMSMAVALGMWTFLYRKKKLLRISQPLFLGMMCLGTFLMASSVLFTGWQEPWGGLDFACMAAPWLLTLGFSTAFSALFTKTWRINRLFQHAVELNRVNVRAKDVLWPFILMTLTNVSLLTAWTLHDPLEWRRTQSETDLDQFGRSQRSYGSCKGSINGVWIVLVGFNFCMVLFANYQSYLGRHIPSDFNETFYVALSMASLLECFLIGAPILFLVAENPTADFVLKAVLVTFCCLAILLPIYFSKFRARLNAQLDTRSMNNVWSAYRNIGGSNRFSGTRSDNSSTDQGHQHDTVARIRASIAARSHEMALLRLSNVSGVIDDEEAPTDLSPGSSPHRNRMVRQNSLAIIRPNNNNSNNNGSEGNPSGFQFPSREWTTSRSSSGEPVVAVKEGGRMS